MRVIIQRVTEASVLVDGLVQGKIGSGILALSGIAVDDDPKRLSSMAQKIVNLRIFPDARGKFQHSLLEQNYGILLVPQFTLFADTSKGRRPEFFGAMKPPQAEEMFLSFVEEFKRLGVSPVEKGVFGAEMSVSLVNHGPVTISLQT